MKCTFNDSMFALLMRFVGNDPHHTFCSREFAKRQMDAIRAYVESFRPEERQERAMEWIEAYAREYRKKWVKDIMEKKFSNHRCPDCPLCEADEADHCQVHARWLKLLQHYAAGEMSSHTYVEQALDLLAQHKEDLKIKLSVLEPTI